MSYHPGLILSSPYPRYRVATLRRYKMSSRSVGYTRFDRGLLEQLEKLTSARPRESDAQFEELKRRLGSEASQTVPRGQVASTRPAGLRKSN
jgi:hypothetical protein